MHVEIGAAGSSGPRAVPPAARLSRRRFDPWPRFSSRCAPEPADPEPHDIRPLTCPPSTTAISAGKFNAAAGGRIAAEQRQQQAVRTTPTQTSDCNDLAVLADHREKKTEGRSEKTHGWGGGLAWKPAYGTGDAPAPPHHCRSWQHCGTWKALIRDAALDRIEPRRTAGREIADDDANGGREAKATRTISGPTTKGMRMPCDASQAKPSPSAMPAIRRTATALRLQRETAAAPDLPARRDGEANCRSRASAR